jgi:hypothetical protein
MEPGVNIVNNEVERFVGELRQLRERELKYAQLVGLVENLMEHRLQDSSEITLEDQNSIRALFRAVSTPEVQDWIDKLRMAGKVDVKRYPTGLASRTSGKLQDDKSDDDES